MTIYNISEKKHFCHAGIDQLIEDVRKGSDLEQTFKSCLIHLEENNDCEKHEILKSELRLLLPKILEKGDVNSKAHNVSFLLNKEKTVLLSKSTNCLSFLQKRELGLPIPLKNYVVAANMRASRYQETVVTAGGLESVLWLAVQDPYVATVYLNKKIKLWDLDQKKCLWEQEKSVGTSEIKMVKDYVIFKNSDYESSMIEIIDIKTGEIKSSFYIESDEVLLLEDRIFCLRGKDKIDEWDHAGKWIQTIPLEKLSNHDLPHFLGSENFIVVIDASNEITIHDRQKNRQKKLQLAKEAVISAVHIDKNHLLLGFESSTCPDACVIDLKKRRIVNQFKTATEKKKEVTKIISNKEKMFFGYSTGELILFNAA